VIQISISESEQPHQYDFNEFQFDYKGVPRQALLTLLVEIYYDLLQHDFGKPTK